jgi:hypothetical protein
MTVYCTAPFNGITVRENGDVKTCCVAGVVIGNLNYHRRRLVPNKSSTKE